MRSPFTTIFVNRSLQLNKIRCVGFDMDATLAIYHTPEGEALAFDLMKKYLIKRLGYPVEIDELRYDPSFPIRGIWFDRQTGVMLKMDECCNILAAWSGFVRLTNQEIRELYPNKHLRLDEERIMVWTTIFHLPEICLLAGVIDVLNRTASRLQNGYCLGESRHLTFRAVQTDLRAACEHIHEIGVFKSIVSSDVGRFIARDDRAVPFMRALSQAGKSVFLLTNSPWNYTESLMSHVMGPKWRTLFDVVIVDGDKPKWFTGNAAFKEVDIRTGQIKLGEHRGKLVKGAVYSGGNALTFRQQMKCVGKDLLYVGDHIIGDVLVSKQITGWRTLLIVPELDREMEIWRRHQDKLKQMKDNFIVETEDPAQAKIKLARIAELTDEIESFYGAMGSVLRCGWRHTHYGSKVRRHADMYTGNVYNMLNYPMDYYFHAPMNLLPHEEMNSTAEISNRKRNKIPHCLF